MSVDAAYDRRHIAPVGSLDPSRRATGPRAFRMAWTAPREAELASHLSEEVVVRVLITGATGYVGGRLVPRLLAAGHAVRCMVRDPARLQGRPWLDQVQITRGDVLDEPSLAASLEGIDVAYYLVHSLGSGHDFEARDLRTARTFGRAAHEAGVGRIVYLGGLGDPATDLSEHLRSRQQTGDALREAGVPVTEFRAAVIVGPIVGINKGRTLTKHPLSDLRWRFAPHERRTLSWRVISPVLSTFPR